MGRPAEPRPQRPGASVPCGRALASLALLGAPGRSTEAGGEEKGAVWGFGQSQDTAQLEGERLQKPSDPTGGLVIDLRGPSGRAAAPRTGGVLCGSDLP